MSFSPGAWSQIKNTTCPELTKALEADGWIRDTTHGAVQAYRNPTTRQRVTIHFHPGKVYGKDTLKALLNDIGWNENDLQRLKLIK
jgi:predicted RNA binding protein YcfA (HicA-like mRNA interferase family)